MRLAFVTVIAGAVGCSFTVSDGNVANLPGEEVWKTEVALDIGEKAFVDGRGLEITLVDLESGAATVNLVSRDIADVFRLEPWPEGGEAKTPPYRVRLLSIENASEGRFEVRREWGEWRP